MSTIDYIDLCDNDVKNIKPELENPKPNGVTIESNNIRFRPKTVALKYIGLSLIKLQYCEKLSKPMNVSSSQNGVNKSVDPKSEIWSSVWTDKDNLFARRYPLKHALEQKFDKGFKCPHNRSTFCQNCNKMSRIQWIHHVRRGHMRIDHEWRKSLKRNQQSGIGNIFEMFCVLCSKNRKLTPLTPNEYIQHLKKLHSNFLPYSDYFTYFQRCYICNDETKSFQNNISHRQMCVTAVTNDPHQAGTANFNNCFKTQINKTIISVEMENDFNKSFEKKLKTYNFFKRTTLHYWLSRKKLDSRKPTIATNGNNKQNQSTNAFALNMTAPTNQKSISFQQYLTNSLLSSTGLVVSLRVTPGSEINLTNSAEKFFMPIPFPLRNEIIVKRSYSDWCKIIHPDYSKVPKVNPLFCELCNAMLKSLNTVIYHMKMCHPGVNFIENQCKSCDKRFITLQGYQLHYKNTRRCPVSRKCGLCNKSVSVNDIYSHLFDSHENNFNKVLQLKNCLICRDTVSEIGTHLFDVHGLTNCFHTRSENKITTYRNGSFFNCTSCSLTFFSEIELRNHMINSQHHFVCAKCPASKFYLYWEKVNHLNSVHGQVEEEISCELCPVDETSNIQKIKFKKASDKVTHFLDYHDSNCHVVLTNMNLLL